MLFVTHNLAIMQLDDAFAHRIDDFLIMSGHDDSRTRAINRVKHLHNAERCRRIQIACRLISKQDLRVIHVRACDSDTLLFAAGQLMRIILLLAGKPNRLKYLRDKRFDGRTTRTETRNR